MALQYDANPGPKEVITNMKSYGRGRVDYSFITTIAPEKEHIYIYIYIIIYIYIYVYMHASYAMLMSYIYMGSTKRDLTHDKIKFSRKKHQS